MKIRDFVIGLRVVYEGRGVAKAEADLEKLKREAAGAAKSTKALSREQKDNARASKRASSETKKLGRAQSSTNKTLRDAKGRFASAGKEADRTSRRFGGMSKASKRAGKALKGLKKSAKAAKETLGGLASVGKAAVGALAVIGAGAAAVITPVIRTGAEFQSLQAQLNNLMQSDERGAAAFAFVKDFAKNTPFQLEQVTKSFIGLQTRGVLPTADTLTSLGDLASSFGGDLESITDAISAASRGELDPLERYGLSAKVAGDQIQLSFRGQTVEVDRSAEAVTNALVAFGKLDGIQGAMAVQMATTTGQISNTKDAWSQFLDTAARTGPLERFSEILTWIRETFLTSRNAEAFGEAIDEILTAVRDGLSSLSPQDIADGFSAIARAIRTVVDRLRGADMADIFAKIKAVVDAVIGTMGTLLDVLGSLLTLFENSPNAIEGMTAALIAFKAVGGGIPGVFTAIAGAAFFATKAIDEFVGKTNAATVAAQALHRAKMMVLEGRIEAYKKRGDIIDQSREAGKKAREAEEKRTREAFKGEFGGLGVGLVKEQELTMDDIEQFGFEIAKGETSRAREAILTDEGARVVAAFEAQATAAGETAAAAAKAEALASGLSEGDALASAERARKAATANAEGKRMKALQKASETYAQTGSVSEAEKAITKEITGKKPKKEKKKKGKKSDKFFDFEKDAADAAKKQGEAFAETELRRLMAEGKDFEEASKLARKAGLDRAKELEKAFREQGRIFDPNKEGILDILGLKGPGSVLDNRPPPQTLLITISPEINLIKHFEQRIENVAGQQALADITGEGGEAAAQAIGNGGMAELMKLVDQMFKLQAKALLAADGGGTQPAGASG